MRAFVAIEISEPIRAALAPVIADLRLVNAPVKWVEPKNIHLTLKFIGSLPDESVPKAIEILRSCVAGIAPFKLELIGVGGFPDLQRPRVVFICAEDQPPRAAELALRLNSRMNEVGAERDERPYQNHITIGRVREQRSMTHLAKRLEPLLGKSFGSMLATEVTLMKSDLTPAGPIYTPVERVKLAG